ncbi:hypothetical protein [Lelliottia nimipressuralis]
MHILAHRGLWLAPEERNTRTALWTGFHRGFGAETDVRDLDGELVISHDMPRRGALPLSVVLEDYVRAGQPGLLALNVKSDGLAPAMKVLLDQYGVDNYFCFDMSVPDTFSYLQAGLRTAARFSEYEPEGGLSARLPVLWVDGFEGVTVTVEALRHWLEIGKRVCLVSPELHGRRSEELWSLLLQLPPALRARPNLMLCTDFPERARDVLL